MLWNMLTTLNLKVKINPRSAAIEWLRKVLAVVLQTSNTKDVAPNQKCPSFQLLVSLQVACLLVMSTGPPWTPFSTTNGLVASDPYWPGHPSTRKEWKLAGLNPGWTSLRMNCHLLALILDLLFLVWNNTFSLSDNNLHGFWMNVFCFLFCRLCRYDSSLTTMGLRKNPRQNYALLTSMRFYQNVCQDGTG